MGATFGLITCVLAVGQPLDRAEWQLTPHLAPGLELVYIGTYTEEALVPGVQYQRQYRLEATALVLATQPNRSEVAFMTALGLKTTPRDGEKNAVFAHPWSVRLELAEVDKQGKVHPRPGVNLLPPLTGPPTLETGAFVELPRTRVGRQHSWEVADEGRPPRTWQVTGIETCQGVGCVKIRGQQQSEDWDRPRADRAGWRRQDTVWLSPQLGIAYKVERLIERRDPARREPTQRSTVRYELESRLQFPGKLFEDRRQEILKARKFHDDAALLLKQPAQYRQQLDWLAKKITLHLENQAPTPYRKALVNLQTRLESARRGDTPPELVEEEEEPRPTAVAIGQRAPDFVVSALTGKETVRLQRYRGRPVLLFFYNPTTPTGKDVLAFARTLSQRYPNNLAIMAMAVSNDLTLVRRQHADMGLSFPILSGQGLHLTFAVEATPRILVLDAEGIVRSAQTGWGFHVPREITEEIQRCLPK